MIAWHILQLHSSAGRAGESVFMKKSTDKITKLFLSVRKKDVKKRTFYNEKHMKVVRIEN